jgi:DNA-binding beta-propeller fold protein YncE
MARPYGLLRAGYPYLKTLGMRRITGFPADVAFGKDKTVYILLRSEGGALIRIWSLDDAEQLTDDLKGIGGYGTEDGQFKWPVQLITDDDGDIFVSDEAISRITRFNEAGEFVAKWGTEGSAEGELKGPSGIAFDNDGNMVVVDSQNHRIQHFTPGGEYLGGFGSQGSEPGQFELPWGVHVDELGDVYVADWGNNRVQKLSPTGEPLMVIGSPGTGDGEFDRPAGVAVDADGDIYVADGGNDRVQMFNQEGKYIWKFLGDASLSRVARTYMLTNSMPNRLREMGELEQEKYLRRPRSVRVDSEFRLFVPDYQSYRIQIYQKDAIPLDFNTLAAPIRNPTLTTT